jgi:predicted phage tail protein
VRRPAKRCRCGDDDVAREVIAVGDRVAVTLEVLGAAALVVAAWLVAVWAAFAVAGVALVLAGLVLERPPRPARVDDRELVR